MQDWQAFGDALRIACPYARFKRRESYEMRIADEPPQIVLHQHIRDAVQDANQGRESPKAGMYLDPTWRLEYERGNQGHWTWKNSCSEPKAYMDCNTYMYKGPGGVPDYIVSGELVLSLQPGNTGHVGFARAFFSLFGKFASNRHQCSVSFPEYRLYREKELNDLWLGHHAIRWLLDDPHRMVDYIAYGDVGTPPPLLPDGTAKGSGYRPIESVWRAKLGL